MIEVRRNQPEKEGGGEREGLSVSDTSSGGYCPYYGLAATTHDC